MTAFFNSKHWAFNKKQKKILEGKLTAEWELAQPTERKKPLVMLNLVRQIEGMKYVVEFLFYRTIIHE